MLDGTCNTVSKAALVKAMPGTYLKKILYWEHATTQLSVISLFIELFNVIKIWIGSRYDYLT